MKNTELNPAGLFDFFSESAMSRIAAETTLESHLVALEERLQEIGPRGSPQDTAELQLQIARTLVGLGRGEAAWPIGRTAFDTFIRHEDWEAAVDVCDVLYQTELDGCLSALGQGIWLAVTYPVDSELSLGLLNHVIEDTPENSDGAAIAATVALFLIDLRSEGQERDDLLFFATQTLGQVARRHSGVESQKDFDLWLDRLGLKEPDKFLPRLRTLIDVLVQDDWWFDRDLLQIRLPVN